MPYIERVVKAGRTIEITRYYAQHYKKKGIERSERKELTKESMAEVNRRKAEERLRWLINTNFKPGDFF